MGVYRSARARDGTRGNRLPVTSGSRRSNALFVETTKTSAQVDFAIIFAFRRRLNGVGGCTYEIKADTCVIGDACYSKNAKDTEGCQICNPKPVAPDN
jgi:hypothetical protein